MVISGVLIQVGLTLASKERGCKFMIGLSMTAERGMVGMSGWVALYLSTNHAENQDHNNDHDATNYDNNYDRCPTLVTLNVVRISNVWFDIDFENTWLGLWSKTVAYCTLVAESEKKDCMKK